MNTDEAIFRQGSTTYFTSSLFFGVQQRQDVTRLYSFVRTADDYVDETPQRIGQLNDLIAVWQRLGDAPMRELEASDQDELNLRVTKNIARLKIIYGFNVEWVDAFLVSMLHDAQPKKYKTLDDSLEYVYGSAEVIGLMMAALLRLPKESYETARLQGRAMQWINFVRDVAEDNALGRCYFPQEDLKRFGLKDLKEATAQKHPEAFAEFMRFQIVRYIDWQKQAAEGFAYLPRRARIAVATASDGYTYTARAIAKDPLVVFDRKVKPSRVRLVVSAAGHVFD
jgi:15-cis-phytoene synthase